MANILIVEDEQRVQSVISDYLSNRGYKCYLADDGIEALTIIKKEVIDLMVLDLMMPHLNGFEVCAFARRLSNMPIIILTAKDSEEDKIRGYELGADDYMTKPFSIKILSAKINALLRRNSGSEKQKYLNAGIIQIDVLARKVFIDNKQLEFTHKEYELLLYFVKNQGQVFSRKQLLESIWGYEHDISTRTIDTHIKTIRQKLGPAGCYIITMVRTGYKFEIH